MVNQRRKEEHERQKFAAALKGINLDEEKQDVEKRLEAVQRRAQIRLAGGDEVAIEKAEWSDLGFGYETA